MKRISIFFSVISVCSAVMILCSCGTIAPKENVATVTAYTGNQQHAGFLGWACDKDWNKTGDVAISESKREEYNALIDLYGGRITPPLKHDDGATPCYKWIDPDGVQHTGIAWSLDREHVVKFSLMKSWQHRGDAPPGLIEKLSKKLTFDEAYDLLLGDEDLSRWPFVLVRLIPPSARFQPPCAWPSWPVEIEMPLLTSTSS